MEAIEETVLQEFAKESETKENIEKAV